jgi:hypothetical protein
MDKIENILSKFEELGIDKDRLFYLKLELENDIKFFIKNEIKKINSQKKYKEKIANDTIKELHNRISFLNGKIEGLEQYIKDKK